jgi:hypothetical protein
VSIIIDKIPYSPHAVAEFSGREVVSENLVLDQIEIPADGGWSPIFGHPVEVVYEKPWHAADHQAQDLDNR